MALDDFDIDSLAIYLHLAPQQVMRLADRGKIPGRKVGGGWRFSRAEIHHWLEERIGVSDEGGLVEVEEVLERSGGVRRETIVIADLVLPKAVAVPLEAKTRDSVIRAMVELAARTGFLWDPDKMAEAVRAREDLYPTALDNGVALLHPRRPMSNILGQPLLALGCTSTGIPFGRGRGGLTDVFFLICSVDDSEHLRTLARLSRVIAWPDFLDELRKAPDAQTALRLIADTEAKLPR